MPTPRRINQEAGILHKYFPAFRWIPTTGGYFVEGLVNTNSGRTYGLMVALAPDYPSSMPDLFVTSPSPLLARNGRPMGLQGPSMSQHVLGLEEEGLSICHDSPKLWNPSRTVYQVVMKGRLWLEAYERHLATGQRIDTYLGHQEIAP